MKNCIFIVSFMLMIFVSCTWYNEEERFPGEICDTTNIKYSIDVKPIFEQNCYSCHSSAAAGTLSGDLLNLEDLDQIQRVVDNGKLLRNIKHEPGGIPMPYKGTKLSDCKINIIENWINRGLPNK
jgi:hypothetical protein